MDSPLAAPIGRVARHPGLLGIALAVVSVLGAGAAFAVDDNPPAPDSPEGVAALLRWCWTHRDAQRYRDLFTADYQFIPQAPDLPWNRDDELRAAGALFGAGTADQSGAASVTLDYVGSPQAGTLHLPSEPYPAYQQLLIPVTLHLDRNDGSKLDASGRTLFHLVRGDLAPIPPEMQARGFLPDPHRWYIQKWEDIPPEGAVVDHFPVLLVPGPTRAYPGKPFTMNVAASDPDGDAITALTAALPPGASFTPGAGNATGQLAWTPTLADTGVYSVTFTASNQLSVSATVQLTVRVNQLPRASLVISPTSGMAPLLVRLDSSGSVDPDGTPRSFRFDFGDGSPGSTQGYPVITHMYPRGEWTAAVTVTDSDGGVDSAKASVSVASHNSSPLASLIYSPSTGRVPLLVTFDANRSRDSDGQITRYDLDFGDGVVQTLTNTLVTHTYNAVGRYTAVLTVTDNEGLTGSASVVVIANGDRPPVVTAPATMQVYARHLVTVTVAASDPDHDPITSLIAHNLPPGSTFHTVGADFTLGRLDWTPAGGDTGIYIVRFLAGNALTDSATTQITVVPDSPPHVYAPSSIDAHVGRELLFTVIAQDLEADPIGSLTASPLGTSVFQTVGNNSAGDFRWTPGDADLGDHTVVFTAANLESGMAQTVIHVLPPLPPDVPPVAALSAYPLYGLEPLPVDFIAAWSDEDGQVTLPYRFDFGDGKVVTQASPNIRHTFGAGTWNARVFVTDDLGASDSATVTVFVSPLSPYPNLARNPSFESGTQFWGPYAGSLLQLVPDAHEGSTGLQITGPPVINGSFGLNDSPDMVRWTLGPGIKYRYTAWVRSPSSHGQAVLRATEYLIAGGAKLGMATSVAVKLSPTWQRLYVDYTTTAANSTIDFQVRDFPLVPSEVFVTDDIGVRNITSVGAGSGMAMGMEDVDGAGGVAFEPRLTPMPMRNSGTLRFATSQSGALRVELLDLSGRRMRLLKDDADAPAGAYELPIGRVGEDGVRLSAGVYFWRVAARDGVKSGRFVMLP